MGTEEKKKILVVDDEPLTLKILSDILEKEGYEVKTSANCDDALLLLKGGDIKVVVADIRMPGKSGIDLLERIRNCHYSLPVILMTGYASLTTAIQAVQHGAFDYLTKPLDFNKVKSIIRRAIENYELVQQNKRLLGELQELNDNLEEKVRERTRRLENILRSTHESIITTDRNLVIQSENPKTVEMFGESCVGRKLGDVIHPVNFDSSVPRLLKDPAYKTEYEIKYDDKYLKVTLSPLVDFQTSSIFGVVAVTDDVTEKKKLEVQLIQSAKMSAIGQLASGIAHEFNNILTGIKVATELAMRRDDVEKIRRDLELVEKASTTATNIISKLLSFARPKEEEFQLAQLDEVIRDTVDLLKPSFTSSGIKILLYSAKVPPIRMNVTEIQQVFLNLAINSKQAMPKGGTIVINVEAEGDFIRVDFSDTGCGIAKENLTNIFDPFFTTGGSVTGGKRRGTGLGLSIVYAIIERHGGRISVTSEVGAGTTFTIWLPNVQSLSVPTDEGGRKGATDATDYPTVKKANVLVVDDEEIVCEIIRESLAGMGHHVVTANDGETASRFVKEDHFDIVFLDVSMPGKNGLEVLKELKSIDPRLRVVMISGSPDENLADKVITQGAFSFLKKPFSLHELRGVVANILGAK